MQKIRLIMYHNRMSLRNNDTVDAIVSSRDFDGIDLIAVDDDGFDDEVERYTCMFEKLKSYMQYIVSGQIYEDDPEIKGKDIRLCVLCKTLPNEAMTKVEALQTRHEPPMRFTVLVTTQEAYLKNS